MDTDETQFSVTTPTVLAVNTLGLDLRWKLAIGDINLCLPPYSIQSALDEKGTEAAAATDVAMMIGSAAVYEAPKSIKVKVDRPFVFAIQHRPSGACLFLGRVTDPR